ncbi:MAG TPA: hypothetical protein VIV82_01280, partial [Verrucomicrobiae bacterium]
ALGTNYQSGDNWKNFRYNFGAKPKPYPTSPELAKRAYNGTTIGKGHLAEAKAAINSGLSGVKSAFARGGNDVAETAATQNNAGGCGSGDTSQRDELLAKIKEAKNVSAE